MVPDRFKLEYSTSTSCDQDDVDCTWDDFCPLCDYDGLVNAHGNETLRLEQWYNWFDEEGENWSKEGITWEGESDKYNIPDSFEDTIRSSEIWKNYGMLKPEVTDVDFMNWMKTAAFPTFRKLHR